MGFTLCFPGFKRKAACFSYDDGVLQDRELVGLFRKHHMRASFNLIPGTYEKRVMRMDKDGNEIDCSHLSLAESQKLYAGMEVANHSLTHPWLNALDEEKNRDEILPAQTALEQQFGMSVRGFAYPFGAYGRETLKVLRDLGYVYARPTRSTYRFSAPSSWLAWQPTIHHRDPLLWDTLDRFLATKEELPVLFVWGHAYEFAIDHNFDTMDALLSRLEQAEDVSVMTCLEVASYMQAAGLVYEIRRVDNHRLVNPSALDVDVFFEGKPMRIPAFSEVLL